MSDIPFFCNAHTHSVALVKSCGRNMASIMCVVGAALADKEGAWS